MKSKTIQEFKETEIGKIPTDWEVTELGNVADVIDPHPSHRAPQIVENGFPFAGIGDIAEDGTIDVLSSRKIGEEFVKQQEESYTIDEFSIGYGRVGTVGKIVQLRTQTFRYALSPTLAVINPKNSIDKKFLNSVLHSRQFSNQVFARITGTTRPTLGIQQLRKLLIMIPPIDEQKSIGKSLSELTRKIQNLQNQNHTLEQIAQAIFKSWFVDFDGVTEFEDSELGKIPKGWSVDKFENHLELTKGVSYKSKELMPSNKALVSLKSINRGGGYTERGLKSFDGKYKDNQIVYENDIVIAQTDLTQDASVIGKPALIRKSNEFNVLIASLDLIIARPKNNENLKFYIYHILLTNKFQNHIYGYTNGTNVLHLGKDGIPNYQFLLPPKKILEKFNQLVSTLIQNNHNNHCHIQTLTKTRDALLPKLMSGEIRV
ncbi:MAG: restriction endonuclease subunit S [Thaumarchaeota archaeon]|nr:restriction endonuclease subunit S [Nitrososphaerota archaeon]MBT7359698.1 restriction endonuclease subunit S [Nitrososphaerota archaeon]